MVALNIRSCITCVSGEKHEQLADQPGWYRDMYRYQQLEAALDDVPDMNEEAADA